MRLILICLLVSVRKPIYIVSNLLGKERKCADIILLFIIQHSITASIWISPVSHFRGAEKRLAALRICHQFPLTHFKVMH